MSVVIGTKGIVPKNFNDDIVWGRRRPQQVRMVPKQQTNLGTFNYPSDVKPNYINKTGLIVRGDLVPKEKKPFQREVSGDGIFDVLAKGLPWIFKIGQHVVPHIPTIVDTGFKIGDRLKADPRTKDIKNKQELINYFKMLLKETDDPKMKMEIIREIGKLK